MIAIEIVIKTKSKCSHKSKYLPWLFGEAQWNVSHFQVVPKRIL